MPRDEDNECHTRGYFAGRRPGIFIIDAFIPSRVFLLRIPQDKSFAYPLHRGGTKGGGVLSIGEKALQSVSQYRYKDDSVFRI
jgi:hypothetical protein